MQPLNGYTVYKISLTKKETKLLAVKNNYKYGLARVCNMTAYIDRLEKEQQNIGIHQFLIRYYVDTITYDNDTHMPIEFVETSMLDIISNPAAYNIKDLWLTYFIQIVIALYYLRTKHTIHDRLSPNCIYVETVNGHPIVKIGEYWLSNPVLNSDHRRVCSCYDPPERKMWRRYDMLMHNNDVWALGCLLYQMLMSEPVYTIQRDVKQSRRNLYTNDDVSISQYIQTKLEKLKPMLESIPGLYKIVERMLQVGPKYRYNIIEVYEQLCHLNNSVINSLLASYNFGTQFTDPIPLVYSDYTSKYSTHNMWGRIISGSDGLILFPDMHITQYQSIKFMLVGINKHLHLCARSTLYDVNPIKVDVDLIISIGRKRYSINTCRWVRCDTVPYKILHICLPITMSIDYNVYPQLSRYNIEL